MNEYIALPLAMLHSDEFRRLSWTAQRLLINLYIHFNDCAYFTIDLDAPQNYGLTAHTTLNPKIHELLRAGLLKIDRHESSRSNGKTRAMLRRVFAFVYPSEAVHAVRAA